MLIPFVVLIVLGYRVSVFVFVVSGSWVICWWGQCFSVSFLFACGAVLLGDGVAL